MRLIDADALKDALVKRAGIEWEFLRILVPLCETIEDAPTIYPEPPKMGKWIDNGDPLTITCGKCGYDVARYNNTPFCPNCGERKEGTERSGLNGR